MHRPMLQRCHLQAGGRGAVCVRGLLRELQGAPYKNDWHAHTYMLGYNLTLNKLTITLTTFIPISCELHTQNKG